MNNMYALGVLVPMLLLGGCNAKGPNRLMEVSSLDRLSSSLDPYEWVQLSRALRDDEVVVGRESPVAYVKYTLSGMTGATAAERDRMLSSVVELGDLAVDALIDAIEHAALPAPIFENAAVANLPIFSMSALARLKAERAVPVLIAYMPKHKSDLVFMVNGQESNTVAVTLAAITGKDYGSDQDVWAKWWESR